MKLVDVYECEDRYQQLYDLLAQRQSHMNISHRVMPSWNEHVEFVQSYPYAVWYFVMDGDRKVGAVYVSRQREVGLFLWPEHRGKGYGTWALKQIIKDFPGRLLANISPMNERSADFFKKHGFEMVQHTYELA